MSHRRTRRFRRNPTTATWLILGAAVAGVAAYAIFSKKSGTTPAPTPGPTPPGTLPVTPSLITLSDACKQKILDILPLSVLTAQDMVTCKANPLAQECLRATSNTATINAYLQAARASCMAGGAPYTGTLPALPAGLPVPSTDCQATWLAFMALAVQAEELAAKTGTTIPPELKAQGQVLAAQLDKACGVNPAI